MFPSKVVIATIALPLSNRLPPPIAIQKSHPVSLKALTPASIIVSVGSPVISLNTSYSIPIPSKQSVNNFTVPILVTIFPVTMNAFLPSFFKIDSLSFNAFSPIIVRPGKLNSYDILFSYFLKINLVNFIFK